MIALFKTFLPSWQFFADSGPVPRLLFRENEGEWRAVDEGLPRWRPWFLLAHPRGNLRLALQLQTQRLLNEIHAEEVRGPQEISASVTYRLLVDRIARRISGHSTFQFKIVVATENGSEDLFLSEQHAGSR